MGTCFRLTPAFGHRRDRVGLASAWLWPQVKESHQCCEIEAVGNVPAAARGRQNQPAHCAQAGRRGSARVWPVLGLESEGESELGASVLLVAIKR